LGEFWMVTLVRSMASAGTAAADPVMQFELGVPVLPDEVDEVVLVEVDAVAVEVVVEAAVVAAVVEAAVVEAAAAVVETPLVDVP
jgi:hypothetical protein